MSERLTADQLLENLRQAAQRNGGAVTIHTNPDVGENGVARPPHIGAVCVHPLSNPDVEYSAPTLTEALTRAVLGELEMITDVSACPGCLRPYTVKGYVDKTEIGCRASYTATGETPTQAWCAELQRYV